MGIVVNGIAHIALSVKDIEKSKIFYKKILPYLGLTLVQESKKSVYHVGARTGILIQKSCKESIRFNQENIGLHHFCFRAQSRNDVYVFSKFLDKNKIKIIRGPVEGPWVKGYYYILFEDPDGIRIEVNFVPGKGVLDENNIFNDGGDY